MPSRALLIAGDIAAFLAFGALGLTSHEDAITLETFARAILPFPVTWLIIAPVAGAFSERAVGGRYSVANVMLFWLAAGVLAMCGRALVFDRELFTAFFAIGIAGAGLFLAVWRGIYNWQVTRRISEVRTLGR
ncbi:MAG: DUF3054 domain-containing protein [Dehalococcoidia bacterium]